MDKLFLAAWLFVSSLFGLNHHNANPQTAGVVTSTPSPTLALSETPDELKVGRSVTPLYLKTNNPMVSFKTISDPTVVQKLYSAILALPSYPTPNPKGPLPGHCVNNAQRVLYDLNFLRNNKLIRHGTLSMTTCSGGWNVSLDGTYKREFTDRNIFVPFRMLLESSFGVTTNQLDGRE